MGTAKVAKAKRKRRECLGCGKHMVENTDTDFVAYQEAVRAWHDIPQEERHSKDYPRSTQFATGNGKFGYADNGFFCTMGCGFRTAVSIVEKRHPNYAPERKR